MSEADSGATAALSKRFIIWVEAYAKRACPDGCLPTAGQEREISLFAEVARTLIARETCVAKVDCISRGEP